MLSVRTSLTLGLALVGLFSACSTSDGGDVAPADDAGAAADAQVDSDKADAAVAPPGAAHPTARCQGPKPAKAAFDPGTGVPDGGVDASADASVDAATDAAIDAGPATPTFIHPPRVVSSGGPVLAMPRWVPIFFQDSENKADFDDFLGSIGCTDYWHAATADYGVGEGIAAPTANVAEPAPAKTSDAEIRKWLVDKINSGTVEAPTPNSVYVLSYPTNTVVTQTSGSKSCTGFGAYHDSLTLPNGTPVAYVVIPTCGTLDDATSAATHELVEAATNPYFAPAASAYETTAPEDVVWAYASGGAGEVADVCFDRDDPTFTPDGYPYAVQRSFSNKASVEGHDPCVPASHPFVYAAPLVSSVVCKDCIRLHATSNLRTTGIFVEPGTTKAVDVVLGSDDATVTSFNVAVILPKRFPLGSSNGPKGTESTLTLSASTGRPGDHLTLTVSSPADAVASEMFALKSTYQGHVRYWYALIVH